MFDTHHSRFEQVFDKMRQVTETLSRLVDYTGKEKVMDRYHERLEHYKKVNLSLY